MCLWCFQLGHLWSLPTIFCLFIWFVSWFAAKLLFVIFLPALILRMFNHYQHVTPPRCLGDVALRLLTLHVI